MPVPRFNIKAYSDYVAPSLGMEMEMEINKLATDQGQYEDFLKKLNDFEYQTAKESRVRQAGEDEHIANMKEKFTLLVQWLSVKRQEASWKRFLKNCSEDVVNKANHQIYNLTQFFLYQYDKLRLSLAGSVAEDDRVQAVDSQVADHIVGKMGLYGLVEEDIEEAMKKLEQRKAQKQVSASLIQTIRMKLEEKAKQAESQDQAIEEQSTNEAKQPPQVEATQESPEDATKSAKLKETALKALAIMNESSHFTYE